MLNSQNSAIIIIHRSSLQVNTYPGNKKQNLLTTVCSMFNSIMSETVKAKFQQKRGTFFHDLRVRYLNIHILFTYILR